jgi:hypothetical protein
VSSSPAGDPGPSFCQNYVDSVTSKLQECRGGSAAAVETLVQTTNACNGIALDLAAGKVVFVASAASACLQEIKALDCGTFAATGTSSTGYPADCGKVFQGTVPIGGACFPIAVPPAQECVGGSHCVANSQCPGVCQPDATLGQSCDLSSAACAEGLTCTYGANGAPACTLALPDVQVGALCAGPSDCASANATLVCVGHGGPIDGVSSNGSTSGTCQKPAASGPCTTGSDCSTYNCVSTVPGSTAGVCTPGKVVGDPCVPGARQCGSGTYCGPASKCLELPVVGQSCAGNAGEGTDCVNGFCNTLTKTCVPFLPAGASCQSQWTSSLSEQCDPINTTCSYTLGVCLPACAPGSNCGGSGQICCANEICAAGLACSSGTCGPPGPPSDAGRPPIDANVPPASTGILLVPDANGYFDGTNAAGVIGAWWTAGDDYGPDGAGGGTCPQAGFHDSECSVINTPTPGQPFVPAANGRGMCTRGTVATVLSNDAGQPYYSAIWGNMVAFDLNTPYQPVDGGAGPSDAGPPPRGQYDALAHGITGIAFDIDSPPPAMNFRVAFTTLGTEQNAPYWGGAAMNYSPIGVGGHYQIHWADVGGPHYLAFPAPFDPSKLESVMFQITTSTAGRIPYSFCINNVVMLTN